MNALLFFSKFHSPFLNTLFFGFTELGSTALLIAVICYLYWCKNKRLAFSLAFGFCTCLLGVQLIKIGLRVDRPWVLDERILPARIALPSATGYSLPSGHTAAATILYGFLFLITKEKYKKVLAILAIAMVGLSRMFLCCHTPLDVVCGFIVALPFLYFSYSKIYLEKIDRKYDYLLFIFLFITGSILFIINYIMIYKGIYITAAIDNSASVGMVLGFSLGMIFERSYVRFPISKKLETNIFIFLIGLVIIVLVNLIFNTLPKNIFISFMKSFLIALWVMAIYPYIFKKFVFKK